MFIRPILIVAIGPSISGKNYQVGPEVVEQFRSAFNMDRLIFSHFTADGRANLRFMGMQPSDPVELWCSKRSY